MDVLWHTKEDDVLKEVASLMGLSEADTYTPGWLRYRTQASKKILDNMPEADMNELQEQAEKIAVEGFSEEKKRK
jgi:hypothetical protein